MEEQPPNVYIFNKTANNYSDLKLLHQTFLLLNCNVKTIRNKDYESLKEEVKKITEADFSLLNYIVIIILDNTNEDEGIWITTDKKKFHTHGDLLTNLHKNRTLKGKLRLAITQTNRVSKSKPIIRNPDETFAIHYPGKDVQFRSTSIGCKLNHHQNCDVPSPFIRILCEEIMNNRTSEKPISQMLNRITDRVAEETDEIPSTEINFTEPVYLGMATI